MMPKQIAILLCNNSPEVSKKAVIKADIKRAALPNNRQNMVGAFLPNFQAKRTNIVLGRSATPDMTLFTNMSPVRLETLKPNP